MFFYVRFLFFYFFVFFCSAAFSFERDSYDNYKEYMRVGYEGRENVCRSFIFKLKSNVYSNLSFMSGTTDYFFGVDAALDMEYFLYRSAVPLYYVSENDTDFITLDWRSKKMSMEKLDSKGKIRLVSGFYKYIYDDVNNDGLPEFLEKLSDNYKRDVESYRWKIYPSYNPDSGKPITMFDHSESASSDDSFFSDFKTLGRQVKSYRWRAVDFSFVKFEGHVYVIAVLYDVLKAKVVIYDLDDKYKINKNYCVFNVVAGDRLKHINQ